MRCTYIGLVAAALSGMAVGARIENMKIGSLAKDMSNHRILADIGSHRKNSSSVSAAKLRGEDVSQLELRNLHSRQAGAACGPQAGRCAADLCCSDYGFCGDSVDHCAPLFDCQPAYGVCGWPRAPATTAAPPPPPTTSAPPPPPTTTSTSTSTVVTTSIVSLPPPTTVPVITPPTTTSRPVVVPPTSTGPILQPTSVNGLRITTNGQCGNGTICVGASNFGPCCSQFFWCGSSLDFCGAGCKSEFGACLGIPGQPGIPAANQTSVVVAPPTVVTSVVVPPTVVISTSIVSLPPPTTSVVPPTTSAPPPPPTTTTSAPPPPPTTTAVQLPPGMRSSTDGKCGSGVTCLGSTFGRCCSQFGWCGDGDQFCPPIVGCQAQFGTCDP
ncbi:hypothetical protein B0T16DRAFT_486562 [Cercophora newfieldiana]|uniref:Chitin-binding type-1 domain-containing protein n=1 Tax=Cercophora newfieldiana TaxID=92897 RepID=A0AA39YLK9_9PEZI|nr:hypothetical protein B0T16DRAFT_486562 [Cercophora newfieldiana]